MKKTTSINDLVERLLTGDQLALARLITYVERDTEDVPEIMRLIHPHTGKAHCVGITGAPGGGKSTLVDRMVSLARAEDHRVGIVAVDPTSPFSGGAVLGDRIRMQKHYLDSGVFIRSMATRGSHGGLPLTANGVVKLFDAFGMDYIFIETVGVGQAELDIMNRSDTVIVVLVPGTGDTVQIMKAGIMEIADVFVVNKMDLPGADQVVNDLEMMLEMGPPAEGWKTPIVTAQANNGRGMENLYHQFQNHREAMVRSGQLAKRRKEQRRDEVLESVQRTIQVRLHDLIRQDSEFAAIMQKVEAGELDPYSAANEVMRNESLLQSCLTAAEEASRWEQQNK